MTQTAIRPPDDECTLDSSLDGVLSAAERDLTAPTPQRVRRGSGFCNELLEVELSGGEVLMVKRAHHEWAAPRLRASRLAAGLLRRRTAIVAPHHLDVEEDAHGRAVEAYWRIELPTLSDLWPDLPRRARPQALRSWGALMRRVHKVKLTDHGSLGAAAHRQQRLAEFLHAELHDRLLPAVDHTWPAAVPFVQQLLEHVDAVEARGESEPVVLVHNDFHMGNVLCEERPRSIKCVGVIDLETAWGGPPEADIAQVQVLHGASFGRELPSGWDAHFIDGYAADLDPQTLAFFRVFHQLNLGYFAAMSGWWEHVGELEAEIEAELGSLA